MINIFKWFILQILVGVIGWGVSTAITIVLI